MKPKALPLVAFALLASSAVSAQTPTAPPAPAAPVVAPAPPAAAAPEMPAAIADAPDAPDAPEAPLAPATPQAPDAPQQAPPPPPVATTLFISGNYLGVRTEEVTRENMQRYGLSGEPRGVGVREVVKGSPAEKAGLRANDVIVRFDGEQVTSVRKLTRLVEESAPEHVVRLNVLRGGAEQELSATLAHRDPFVSAGGQGYFNLPSDIVGDALRFGEEAARNSEQWKLNEGKMRERWEELARRQPGLFGSTRRIGVATDSLGKQLADYFGVAHGVLINSVEEGSPAEKAGLKAGDIVTEADGRKVEDSDDLSRAISAKQEGEVMLTVVRDRKQRTVRVTPERRAVPQGLFAPGTFHLIDTPVAALKLPPVQIQMHPDLLSLPRTLVAPRPLNAPRLRALGSGNRVL